MPQPQMMSTGPRLKTMTIEMEDSTLDLVDGIRLTVRLTWSDGMTATVLSTLIDTTSMSTIPEETQDLADAFLWGEGARAVLAHCQRLDHSAQSRRVRTSLASRL